MDINLNAPINKLGYGNASKNILRSLLSQGHSVALFPINRIQHDDVDVGDVTDIKQSLGNAVLYNDKAPSVRIWHQNDLAPSVGRGLRVGFPFFELNKFNEVEKHHLSSQDALFVSSEWAKQVVVENGIKAPTFVVPLGVDTNIFKPIIKAKRLDEPVVFLNVGKWEIRKGHDVLVTAFNLAFKPEDNVELWMMNHNPFLTQEQTERWHDIYLGSALGQAGKIKILGRVDSHEEVAKIMGAADVGVFPARAEGWNLELLEMMAMGKFVVATNCTAHTEFCNSSNALLVEAKKLEDAHDGIWFHGQGQWHQIDEEEITVLTDRIAEGYNYVKRGFINAAGVTTGQEFTWQNTARLMIKHLEALR